MTLIPYRNSECVHDQYSLMQMNSNNVTSHEFLDPKKRPNDANKLLLFSGTSINNETHSNEILHIRMVTGSIFLFSIFSDT